MWFSSKPHRKACQCMIRSEIPCRFDKTDMVTYMYIGFMSDGLTPGEPWGGRQ